MIHAQTHFNNDYWDFKYKIKSEGYIDNINKQIKPVTIILSQPL